MPKRIHNLYDAEHIRIVIYVETIATDGTRICVNRDRLMVPHGDAENVAKDIAVEATNEALNRARK